MAYHSETTTILRRILYITIFLFAIYGITSISILVDQSRRDKPVLLSTALILLAILLAFIFIFAIIIWLWRREKRREKWNETRQRVGTDEENRWVTMPDGTRYLMTERELKELKRKEKRARREKRKHPDPLRQHPPTLTRDRARSTSTSRALEFWQRNHLQSSNNNAAQNISAPHNPIDASTGAPLQRVLAAHQPFVPEPLFANGIFGGRPAMGAGLNPNHGLSPPASPKTPSKAVLPRPVKVDTKEETAWRKGREKEVAALNIPRKEVGSPPREKRVDTTAGQVALVDGKGGKGSGVVIGVAGETIEGIGTERLPPKLVGHRVIAIPHHAKLAQRIQEGRGLSRGDDWRMKSGVHASKKDRELSTMGEEMSIGRDGSKKSWGEMTADEVECERRRMKEEVGRRRSALSKTGSHIPVPVSAGGANVDTKRRAGELAGTRKKARGVKQVSSVQPRTGAITKAAIPQRAVETTENRSDQKEFETETQLLHNATPLGFVAEEENNRKLSDVHRYTHLSALPDSLRIFRPSKTQTEVSHIPLRHDTMQYPAAVIPNALQHKMPTPKLAQTQFPAKLGDESVMGTPNYHPPIVSEEYDIVEREREGETEWQTQKRLEAWVRQNEEENARRAALDALRPACTPFSFQIREESGQESTGKEEAGVKTLSDWHRYYKADAQKRGVRGFTATTSTTEVEANERFSSCGSIDRKDVDVAGPLHNTSISQQPRTAIDTLPSQIHATASKLAQEHERERERIQGAAAQLEVRSLKSTERGTMISSFHGNTHRQLQPQQTVAASAGLGEKKSGIPRAVVGKVGKGEVKALPGVFGYVGRRAGGKDGKNEREEREESKEGWI